jgi:choline-glycine betaine transporter
MQQQQISKTPLLVMIMVIVACVAAIAANHTANKGIELFCNGIVICIACILFLAIVKKVFIPFFRSSPRSG